MCRAEAHQLYARKPIFDVLGVQLIAVLHEQIESEVMFSAFLPYHCRLFLLTDGIKMCVSVLIG